MPPRVSSSVQGLLPGTLGMRFSLWQALVAEPMSTNMLPFASIDEGMHRMIAGQRHAGHDDLRLAGRHDAVCGRSGVADDLVVHFGVDVVLVESRCRCRPRCPRREAGPKRIDLVGLAVALGVLQRDQEAAGGRRVVAVVAAAPGVDVDDPAGATAMWRAWPRLSAKTVAQKPGDSVIPPASALQSAGC